MKTEYMIIAAALVGAYLLLRSGTARAASAGGSLGGVVVGGRVYRPDANGYYRNDDGGVTRWLA